MTEILVWGDPTKEFERLNINPKCTWLGRSNIGGEMRVYGLSEREFEILCNDTMSDANDAWQNCGWRSAIGSNMGCVEQRYNINNHYIIAWDGATTKDILNIIKNSKEPERKYKNLLEYFCDEIGASQPRNVCALAVDLAEQNGITMAELFEKYQGEGGRKNER